MDRLQRNDVAQLANTEAKPCVSIYMPLEREADKQDKNRILLKTLLKEARQTLVSQQGMDEEDAVSLLEPAAALIDNGRFQVEYEDGLALFLTPETATSYALPLNFAQEVVVGPRFYLTPLLPYFTHNGRFYTLALSQDEIRLYHSTRYNTHYVELGDDVPDSLADAMRWEDPEQQMQWHTSIGSEAMSVGASAVRRAMFHGHGVGDEEMDKNQIRRYFQQVDDGIQEILGDDQIPLVLAGVDFLHPLYREASDYDSIVDETIQGNPEQWSAKELHQKAWQIMEPIFAQEQEAAAARYGDLTNTEEASDNLDAIVPAAHYGQVDVLFVSAEAKQWGQFDPATGDISRDDRPTAENIELLNDAAMRTFLQDGVVYAIAPEDMPSDQPAAAIFRYPPTA